MSVKVSVELLSETYNIKTELAESELLAMRDLLNSKMAIIQEKQPGLNYKTIAVLSALEIANDYLALKKEYDNLTQLLKEEKLLFWLGEKTIYE